jgi:hypothetical protein
MEGERFSKTEQSEWIEKYDPRKLKLGMVTPDDFVDPNDEILMNTVRDRVRSFETHVGESLPDDFYKYLVYCGPMFFNWSCMGIPLHGWNEKDEKDQRPFCLWCEQPLEDTKCTCNFDTTKKVYDDTPGVIVFSHEGCGFFTYIIVKGPLKGTLWINNRDRNRLRKIESTFKELLDEIYSI